MTNRLTLVVMAAGLGSRFNGQKQWAAIGPHGESLLDYAIYDALSVGFERVVLIVRETDETALRQRMRETVGDRCAVAFACQRMTDLPEGFGVPADRKKPWGTGHAVWAARRLVDGPFAAINADDFYGRAAFATLAEWLAGSSTRAAGDQAMIGYRLGNTLSDFGPVSRGVCEVSPESLLRRIVERHRIVREGGSIVSSEDGEAWSELPSESAVSINLWGFGPFIFDALTERFEIFLSRLGKEAASAEFGLSTEIGRLITAGIIDVRVLPTDERWFGITYREDLGRARTEIVRRIDAGEYPEALWQRA